MRNLFLVLPTFTTEKKNKVLETFEQIENVFQEQKLKSDYFKTIIHTLIKEYKMNDKQFKKSYNSKVSFNENFQLLHIVSNQFVAFDNLDDKYGIKENINCYLTKFPSSKTELRLLPVYEHQIERASQEIYNGEEVFITSNQLKFSTTWYLGYKENLTKLRELSKTNTSELLGVKAFGLSLINTSIIYDKNTNAAREQSKKLDHIIKKAKKLKVPARLSLVDKKTWKIKIHSHQRDSESKSLLIGDIVWLINLEQNASLRADVKIYKDLTKKVYYKQHKHAGLISTNQNLEIHHFQSSENNQNIDEIGKEVYFENNVAKTSGSISLCELNGLWVIESEHSGVYGGNITSSNQVMLRHFVSGRYLSVQKKTNGKGVVALTDLNYLGMSKPSNLFQLELSSHKLLKTHTKSLQKNDQEFSNESATNSTQRNIQKDSLVLLKNNFKNDYIGLNYRNDIVEDTIYFDEITGNQELHNIKRFETSLQQTCSEIQTMKIIKSGSADLYETNFLQSCQPFLKRFYKYNLKRTFAKDEGILDEKYCLLLYKLNTMTKATINCLEKLNQYLENLILSSSLINLKDVIKQRQDILKSLGFINLQTEILEILFDKGDFIILKQKIDEKHDLTVHRNIEEYYRNNDTTFFKRIVKSEVHGKNLPTTNFAKFF